MKITLKDGSIKEYASGMTAEQIAKDISENLWRAALIARVNGELVDLKTQISGDSTLEILTYRDEEGREAYKIGRAHV